jgi:hypothetical protein
VTNEGTSNIGIGVECTVAVAVVWGLFGNPEGNVHCWKPVSKGW